MCGGEEGYVLCGGVFMRTDLALGGGEGCPLFGGVYTICGVVEEDLHYPGEFVPTVRLRFMGECGTGFALCWEVNTICGVDTWGGGWRRL